MAAGVRVIRGPDWNLDDEDGGEGHVGTVVETGTDGKVNIVWDGGEVSICRSQGQGGHDLRVLDNATVGIRHPHVVCDECHESGIVGIRWKCAECVDYDLCSMCYFSDHHDTNHQFLQVETPNSTPVRMEKRSKSMKMRVLGVFPDATVQRGIDWEWKDQDGGPGKTGRVIELQTPAAHSARSTVKVEWESTGRKNVYRMGYKGKVDLQYTEEAPGLECYPQHLPAFDIEHYSEEKLSENRVTDDNITEGDRVIISVTADELQQLQKSRSGWAVGMADCIGKVGKVQGFAANGDAVVGFGNKKYRLFPGALKKVANIDIGDRVRVLDDEDRVKLLQDGHGGYNHQMRTALGKVGEVIKIDEDGDVVVQFGGRHWVYNPACVVPAPGAEIDHISKEAGDSDDGVKISLGSDQGSQFLALLAALAQSSQGGGAGETIFLKLIADNQETAAMDMLRKNPSLATAEAQGFTALHVATNRGFFGLSKALIEGGAKLNQQDKDGDTPLMAGLAGGKNEQLEEYLVSKGCDLSPANKDGQTAGHKAALAGHVQVLRAMVAKGANFAAQDNAGDTPLHDCISKSNAQAAGVILSSPNVDLRLKNKKGFPLLHYAALRGEPDIAALILKKDATLVNDQKEDGFTPLHVCACNNHHDVMRVILEKGKPLVDLANTKKQTPLHVAAHEAAFECVRLLVDHGADIHRKDDMGNTALHVNMAGMAAASSEEGLLLALLGRTNKINEEARTRIACFLIERGLDPDIKNNDGLSALDVCPSEKVTEAVKRFIANGGKSSAIGGASGLLQGMASMHLSQSGDSSEPSLCPLCQSHLADVLFVPCGHRVFCKECCQKYTTPNCPRCKVPVKNRFDKGAFLIFHFQQKRGAWMGRKWKSVSSCDLLEQSSKTIGAHRHNIVPCEALDNSARREYTHHLLHSRSAKRKCTYRRFRDSTDHNSWLDIHTAMVMVNILLCVELCMVTEVSGCFNTVLGGQV
ncbi:hypothetical protein BaRGS_00035913 [Batillaria attramentaria]|uniref:RING-type E3 ubiquitin transferase n=1 Tax=Batillaria attramentaria TaxID=370345 RepID=A0ABD0JCS9_9CAEN